MRSLMLPLFLLAPVLLASCATAPEGPPKLTEKQTQALEKALEGKTPGDKVTCIQQYRQTNLQVISDQVLLYKVSNSLVYKNEVMGRCSGLTRGDTLITQSFGGQLCRRDIARVANLMVGTLSGVCSLGDFVPYRRVKK
ncbi:MAG: DUF6491 family protein [Sphingobium phenoxybenzoativorans]